ncbi:MAG: DUF2007 domain-containing protein [Chloroflexota bacterium]|nr:DUF2007 domain-containing protein [Chloroflexota bacterium]
MKTNKPKAHEEFVAVYTSMGPLRAEVVKGRLVSAGIPAFLKYESAGRVFAVIVDGMGEVQVMVAKENQDAARKLLAEKPNDT